MYHVVSASPGLEAQRSVGDQVERMAGHISGLC